MMEDLQWVLAKNLKRIRETRGLSLEKLALLTSVSKSMLGQIERGESNPTLTTVWKIANGLKVGLTELIKEHQEENMMVRKEDIQYLEEDSGKSRIFPYFTFEEGRPFEVYTMGMEAKSYFAADPHTKGTVELLIVHEGELTLRVGDQEFTLQQGDAARFKGDQFHAYHNTGNRPCTIGIVIYYQEQK